MDGRGAAQQKPTILKPCEFLCPKGMLLARVDATEDDRAQHAAFRWQNIRIRELSRVGVIFHYIPLFPTKKQ